MDEAVARFLVRVAATGDSRGFAELLGQGAAFAASLLRLACDPRFPQALLAATLLKQAVDACRGAVGETRARLVGCPPLQQEGPLGEQLREAAARVAFHQWPGEWPGCVRECPPRLRPVLLRTLRRRPTQAERLREEAQWCVEQGGPLPLLRQAAKCGARLPLERLAAAGLPRIELLRLVRCSREEHWAALRPAVAAAAAAAAPERPALCCALLQRCGNVGLAATTALRLLAAEEDEEEEGNEEEEGESEAAAAAGRLWEQAFGLAPRECVALLQRPGVPAAAAARALLCSETETLLAERLLSPWRALEALLLRAGRRPSLPALRLLGRWAAELPGPAECAACVALCRRDGRPAALEALAAVVCDARYEGPRDNAPLLAAALAAAAAAGGGPGRLLPLLRGLWLLLDARGERGGLEGLPRLWPACRGHPLLEALLLRAVAAGCPAAPDVPGLVRAALATAREYLLDDILQVWQQQVQRCPGDRSLLPLLPPLLAEPAAWELLAQYARAGALAGPVSLPPLPPGAAAGEPALLLRRLGLLETLLQRPGGALGVPAAEVLALARPPHHPAVRCRAAALACSAGLPALPLLQELLPQLEEWLPPDALRPCLLQLSGPAPRLEQLDLLAPLCLLAEARPLGRDLLRRAAAAHGPEAVARAVADPAVFEALWNCKD